MRKQIMLALGAVVLVAAPRAGAQVFTPTYQSPVAGQDVGVYLFDAGEVGVEGVLRRGMAGGDLGLRAGFSSSQGGDALLLGADFRKPLQAASVQPLDLSFTLGAQVALLDAEAFGAQVGVSAGYTFQELNLTPYIHPRLALINAADDTELKVLADVGFDVDVTSRMQVRLGINLGDGADWGIGLAFRR